MIGFSRTVLAPGSATIRTILLLTLVLMLGAAGCGSDGGTTVPQGTAGRSDTAGPAGAGQQPGESGEIAGGKGGKDGAGGSPGGKNKRTEANGTGKTTEPRGQDAGSARRRHVKRKLEEECPPDVDEASCKAMVDGFIAEGGHSQGKPLNDPGDCTRTRSKEECEASLKAQKAAEGTYSVDVEECLDDPTPRCEAVLRPLFERQQAAEEAGS